MEAITLENRHVQATLVPSLGGRIVSLVDKRTATEVLAADKHIGWANLAEDTKTHTQVREADGSAAVSLFALTPDLRADVWVVVSLGESDRSLGVSVRIHSRTLLPTRLPALARFAGVWETILGDTNRALYNRSERAGLHLGPARLADVDGQVEWRVGSADPELLMPCRTVESTLTVAPFSGIGNIHGLGSGWVAERTAGSLEIVPVGEGGGFELHVETTEGATLKAAVELRPDQATVVSLDSLPPINRMALMATQGFDLATEISDSPLPEEAPPRFVSKANAAWPGDAPSAEWVWTLTATRSEEARGSSQVDVLPGTEAGSLVSLARASSQAGVFIHAATVIDDALRYAADDPLLWWAKAAVARHIAADPSFSELADGVEDALPNAHFLSPMEPMLRVEAFLAQEQAQGKEANPLLADVAADNAIARDCLCRLAVWGLWADFARVADDLLRHSDDPMVRYLLAWALCTQSRMLATAAEHLAAAGRLTLEAAIILSPLEKRMARELQVQFPGDAGLKRLGVTEA
ncbi:MAG: DUF5107 domain-containing protein [Armatimonadetes bacterium]|nr:DUF5107 domain-containing protein [Armatimonadota bacterium]